MTLPGALKITADVAYPENSSPTSGDNPQVVPVNSDKILRFASDLADIVLSVSVANFKGSKDHLHNSLYKAKRQDKLSIVIQLKPHQDIRGDSLLFGNDFGYPIRQLLPYGAGIGLKIFQRTVDPSVKGDLYADKPWLYGSALSSFTLVNVSETDNLPDLNSDKLAVQEDTTLLDVESQNAHPIPSGASQRSSYFTNVSNLQKTTLKKDLFYLFVFNTSVLSLEDNNFKIMLPGGYGLDLRNYLGSKLDDTDASVRYVLKLDDDDNKPEGVERGIPLLVITFQLVKE